MIVPDTNILLYAHAGGHGKHEPARAWWEEVMNGQRPVGLDVTIILGFLRIVTNPRAMPNPMPPTRAIRTIQSWIQQPQVTLIQPGPDHYDHVFRLLQQLGIAGNMTADAHLAALSIQWQAEVATCDSDFARFPKVRWFNPLTTYRS